MCQSLPAPRARQSSPAVIEKNDVGQLCMMRLVREGFETSTVTICMYGVCRQYTRR